MSIFDFKIGIIPFNYFRGNNKPAGSSFLRVDALVNNTCDFEKWQHGKKYDGLIFQKAYWKEMMEAFDGPMILDICDPDWIKNGVNLMEVAKLVHAVTCSSDSLTRQIRSYIPKKSVIHVPDRLDLKFYPKQRAIHSGKARTVVWFGFIHNAYETLPILAPAIKKHRLKLKIIANLPYTNPDEILELGPEFYHYDHSTAYELIKTGDIALNPRSDLAFFKYKSNNKNLISWHLGLPVAGTEQELESLIDAEQRNHQVNIQQEIVRRDYGIGLSAEQYRQIFADIRQQYF